MSSSMAAKGRLGGLSTAARYDGVALTQRARDTYRKSFADGHSCRVCPRIDIPADLPDAERQRRGEFLRRMHYTRLGQRRQAA